VLEQATEAPAGTVPVWGQTGEFTIDLNGMKAHIKQEGIFGTVASHHLYPALALTRWTTINRLSVKRISDFLHARGCNPRHQAFAAQPEAVRPMLEQVSAAIRRAFRRQ
jgi:hypothetical protein